MVFSRRTFVKSAMKARHASRSRARGISGSNFQSESTPKIQAKCQDKFEVSTPRIVSASSIHNFTFRNLLQSVRCNIDSRWRLHARHLSEGHFASWLTTYIFLCRRHHHTFSSAGLVRKVPMDLQMILHGIVSGSRKSTSCHFFSQFGGPDPFLLAVRI